MKSILSLGILILATTALHANALSELVQKKIKLEEQLYRDWSIVMGGDEGQEGADETLSFYVSLMEKISTVATARKYQPRDSTENYTIGLQRLDVKNGFESVGKKIRVSADDASVGKLINFFEGLPSKRTYSESAMIERLRSFIRNGDEIRLQIEDPEGARKELRFQPVGSKDSADANSRWIKLP